MRPYSPGGVLNALASAQQGSIPATPSTHRLRLGLPGYLIPFAPPSFRASASVSVQEAAFATGVPPDIYAFHRYTGNSASLSRTQATQYPGQFPQLSRGISHRTYKAAYAPFTPSNSEQRLPPLYYRGCWHRVSRGFLSRVQSSLRGIEPQMDLRPGRQEFTTRRPSSSTRRCFVRLSPIAKNSPLLPPVGVWAVSQSQCGRPPSQAGYRSSPWWAVTPPTS